MVAAPIILAGGGGGGGGHQKDCKTKILGGPVTKKKSGGDLSKKLNLGGPKILGGAMNIVGKGVIPPPFLRSPFLEIQDVPNFHRSIRKTE